jgi:hypothetical protein
MSWLEWRSVCRSRGSISTMKRVSIALHGSKISSCWDIFQIKVWVDITVPVFYAAIFFFFYIFFGGLERVGHSEMSDFEPRELP